MNVAFEFKLKLHKIFDTHIIPRMLRAKQRYKNVYKGQIELGRVF